MEDFRARNESWLSAFWDKAAKLGVKAASAVELSDIARADFSPNADVAMEKRATTEESLIACGRGVWKLRDVESHILVIS